jgi:acyl carrier protein
MSSDTLAHEHTARVVRTEIARRLKMAADDPALRDDQTFEALGLGSLDLIELVDGLESVLRVDPFASQFSLNDVRTVGDLCRAYDATLDSQAQRSDPTDPLQASRARAAARRRTG